MMISVNQQQNQQFVVDADFITPILWWSGY